MIVKRLLTGVFVCSFWLLLSAQQRVKMVVNDLFVPDEKEVLSGYVGDKLAERILGQMDELGCFGLSLSPQRPTAGDDEKGSR